MKEKLHTHEKRQFFRPCAPRIEKKDRSHFPRTMRDIGWRVWAVCTISRLGSVFWLYGIPDADETAWAKMQRWQHFPIVGWFWVPKSQIVQTHCQLVSSNASGRSRLLLCRIVRPWQNAITWICSLSFGRPSWAGVAQEFFEWWEGWPTFVVGRKFAEASWPTFVVGRLFSRLRATDICCRTYSSQPMSNLFRLLFTHFTEKIW